MSRLLKNLKISLECDSLPENRNQNFEERQKFKDVASHFGCNQANPQFMYKDGVICFTLISES